ncbi:hypothetical protein DLJ49_19995 [Rhodovulum sp. 12E13]|uniref:major capsid protein n=1 Tax=Rhodovulum sp. 12E13 TaxID=2203891 RepID=UPI000E17EFA0|nr:major capsid protein [Rhodovulum sp. 12E13]RDC68493.1 hypothetical protein DLJ49_19995 [Rhodovulum sp. 12E13]
MPLSDVFTPDAFGTLELTLRVNELERFPHRPSYFSEVFEEDFIATTTVQLESRSTGVQTVGVGTRGTVAGSVATTESQNAYPVNSVKVGNTISVTSQDIQDRRGAGTLDLETVQAVQDRRIAEYLRSHEITREQMQLSAAKGVWTLPDGSTGQDYFSLYGVNGGSERAPFELDLLDSGGTGLTNHHLREKIGEFIGLTEDRLGGVDFSDVDFVCGKGAFNLITNFDEVREDFARWQALARPTQTPLAPFRFAGANIIRYRGAGLAENEILPVIRGVPGMYRSVYTRAMPGNG